MKILFVDIGITGHHLSYLSALIDSTAHESIVCLPDQTPALNCRQIILPPDGQGKGRKISDYLKWVLKIRGICKTEKPDLVHFVYGDSLYRFFGVGLDLIGRSRKIITIHSLKTSRLGQISLKRLSKKCDCFSVHSEYILNNFHRMGIHNVVHIEYPHFNSLIKQKAESERYFGLREKVPVIACLGGTEKRKGLDILLDALNQITVPFQLLVAGTMSGFDEAFIYEKGKKYADRISLHLSYLSDDEFALAIGAADIIALPYRKSFNGASGPLGEGVAQNKCIVASDHGNLGYTVKTNHLGDTFEAENSDSLASVLETALHNEFTPDEKYQAYRESLNPEHFKDKYENLYRSLIK